MSIALGFVVIWAMGDKEEHDADLGSGARGGHNVFALVGWWLGASGNPLFLLPPKEKYEPVAFKSSKVGL